MNRLVLTSVFKPQTRFIAIIPQFVRSGVNTVTDAVTDTKDQIIAKGIMQNVGTLNAIKKEMRDRNEPDPITITLSVNFGVANTILTTTYVPEKNIKN